MYCVYIYESDNQINNSGVFDFAKSRDISEDNVFIDTSKDRDNLKVLVEYMDSEDCLVVRSIIDLVEDSRQLMDTLQVLQASQVALVSQLEPFLNGKEYYNCLKGFIEIHKYYLNRKRAKGYDEAMKAGLVGRPAKTDEIEKAIHLYHTQAFSINEIEKLSGVSSSNIAVNGVDRYQSYANKLGNITKHKDLLNKQLYNYEYDITEGWFVRV